MATKKNSFPTFQERLNEIRKAYPDNIDFAQAIGVSRQTAGAYLNGDRVPDAKNLQRIAQKTGVSADWLLGLSKAKTSDGTLRAATEYTGLSDESLKQLKEWTSSSHTYGYVIDVLLTECHDVNDTNITGKILYNLDRLFRYTRLLSVASKTSDLSNEDKFTEYQLRNEVRDLLDSLPARDIQMVTTEDFITDIKYKTTCAFQELVDDLVSLASSNQLASSVPTYTDEDITEEQVAILAMEEDEKQPPPLDDEYLGMSEEEKKAYDKRSKEITEELMTIIESKKESQEPDIENN